MSNEDQNQNNQEIQAQESFPQYLCKMCGKCCRAIVPEFPHDELIKLSNEGDEEAKVFVDIFKRYPTIDDARKVVPEHVDQIIDVLKDNENFDITKVSFYYCPYVTEDNLCSIHEERPECCRRAPRNGWSLFPPGCGFKGWQFEMREKHKKSIRFLKEYVKRAEHLHDENDIAGNNMTLKQLKDVVEKKIKPWERYGSRFW